MVELVNVKDSNGTLKFIYLTNSYLNTQEQFPILKVCKEIKQMKSHPVRDYSLMEEMDNDNSK